MLDLIDFARLDGILKSGQENDQIKWTNETVGEIRRGAGEKP